MSRIIYIDGENLRKTVEDACGFMVAQYAAAVVSENNVLTHPASVDSIPTSCSFYIF